LTASVDRAFRQALGALQTGNVADAAKALQKVLHQQPQHVGALNLYSVLLTKTGQFAEAERYIKRALQENSRSDASFYNYGVILNALKRPQEAIEQFDKALALNPSVAETWNGRGEAQARLEQNQEAIGDFDKALALDPRLIEALVNKARALAALEQYETALGVVDQALALRPDHALAWLARANVLADDNRLDEALAACERVIAAKPDLPEAWVSRGSVYSKLDRPQEALVSYDKAVQLRPENAEAWSSRGSVLLKLHRNHDARIAFDKALELAPDSAFAWLGRGDVLVEFSRYDDALMAFNKAIELKSDFAAAHSSMSHLLRIMGRMDEAQDALRQAIKLKPDNGVFYQNLIEMKKIGPGDPDLAAMEELDTERLSNADRKLLHFALGKAYADLRDYRRSFRHYLAGNAAERASIEYNEPATFAYFDDIEKNFTPELIAAKSGMGLPSSRPIFVVGMPRSGSTLVEQILASHSQVTGAGEIDAFSNAIVDSVIDLHHADGSQMRFPGFASALSETTIKSIGEKYLERLAAFAPQGERATDKMLMNYFYVGLIHLALPNAVILHTVRDPVDTCISCFSKKFTYGINYTYDLGELGRYYTRYRRLMEHWHRVLPVGRILDVKYEDVVADLEGQARRILAHCGLQWEDRCLAFHETERPVRTASVGQVRQPIYKSSVGRWREYEDYLGPLLQGLGMQEPAEV
jgi:tetratricopeptide (TPR) repeat protein